MFYYEDKGQVINRVGKMADLHLIIDPTQFFGTPHN